MWKEAGAIDLIRGIIVVFVWGGFSVDLSFGNFIIKMSL
jgi:hypothetical protein